MPNYLTKEEIRQWRSSLEKITLEEFAARLGKEVEESKPTNDVVDIVMSRGTSSNTNISVNDGFSKIAERALDVYKRQVVRGVTFYGGNQGDTILANANNTIVYCGNGSNKITISNGLCYGGAGNNEVSMNHYTRYYGGSGVNNITVSGRYNYIESGSASMNVTLKGSDNTIYGAGGNNTIVSNTGSNNFISGFGDADNAQALSLAKGETKNLTINGINYTVKNTNSKTSNALLYTVNPVRCV